jgi:hypothetical protein
MNDYYGYNPSQYVNDFSWIGQIGQYVGKFASEMPELLEMNKQIKENNKMKEVLFSRSNQFVDKLTMAQLTKVASSMGLEYNTPEDAKIKLKEMIPKFGDKSTNEEYAGQIVNSFFGPVMQHAQSDKAGSPISIGDILNMVNEGNLQKSMLSTSMGQEYKEEQTYQKEFARKFGDSGEVRTEQDIRNKGQLTQEQALAEQELQRKQEYHAQIAPIVDEAIKSGKSSDQVYADVYKETNDPDMAKEAAAQVRNIEQDELKTELRKMQDDARKAIENQEKLSKVYDLDKIDKAIGTVEFSLAKYESIMANSKNMSSGEKANYKGTINLLKKQLAVYEKTKIKLIEAGGSVSPDEANKARLSAYGEVDRQYTEQDMIDKWTRNIKIKDGGYSGGTRGRDDDRERFKQEYIKRFGVAPKFDNKGNPISQQNQYGNFNPTVTQVQEVPNVSGGLAVQKAKNTINALESAIQKESDPKKIEQARSIIAQLKQQYNIP